VSADPTALLEQARAAWPALRVEAAAFLGHLAARAGQGRVEVADLYLAFAAASADPAAVAAFERDYLAQVPRWLSRLGQPAAFVDEVQQVLRTRMLTGDPPKLTEYAGRGALGSWLRVSANRVALNLIRAGKREEPAGDRELEVGVAMTDPELAILAERYRAPLAQAFRDALAVLSARDRNLLRLHFVEGTRLEDLGAVHRVDKSTVSRWLTRAKSAVRDETHRLLNERLAISDSEAASLVRLVRSRLDLSLRTLLGG
jgi:RNA polymerase sigma-70 factor (ECF subfamily)